MKNIAECQEVFEKIMKSIAAQFGDHCEVVLHDYARDYQHSITAIENGHVTGRSVGDCGTNLGLEVLRGTTKSGDRYGYLTRTKDGKLLKSSSVYFQDDQGKPIGALCINYDVSELSYSVCQLQELTGSKAAPHVQETHSRSIEDVLKAMIDESLSQVGKPVNAMTREEKAEGLKYLDRKGAFLIKRAKDKIAKAYGISLNTLYNYLEAANGA